MNTSHPTLGLAQFIHLVREYPRRWALPALALAAAALVFALVRPATWEASQALIIRNEAAGGHNEPGSFDHTDEMKTVQETILELSKSRGVLRSALVEVGPPANDTGFVEAWPSQRDVGDLRDAITLGPPKGAEFGTTEVFYLNVKDHDRARAVALAEAVCDQLETRFQEIRDAKASSMIGELANAAQLAQADLDKATRELSAIEKQVGPDLAELRILNEATNGDSTLRRTIGEISTELRQARGNQETNRELLALLEQAQHDQGQLLAAPNQLLESQTALRRLKDGLIDAQIQTAQLTGRMSDVHPLVRAARESEKEIGRHLHRELAIALRGVKAEWRLTGDRIHLLEERLAEVTGRLDRLAELRAPYANQLAVIAHRTQVLQQAEQRLSRARATQASASVTNLISRIDTPDTGTNPLGPGRAMIVLFGIVGGLLVGLGVLLLAAPSSTPVQAGDAAQATPTSTSPATAPVIPARLPSRCMPYASQTASNSSLAGALQKLNGNGRGPSRA
ncbi:MAG: hypothetical protein JW888_09170 [Pirellulales bacterium]|nr:hypothetical protein [Pirellulales bacterium]